MTVDGGFSGTGYARSPVSGRVYLVNNGFVIGEVPPELEPLIAGQRIREDLHAEVELEYLGRKTGNLMRYQADLREFRQPELGARLALRGAADFRVANLLMRHVVRAPIEPRLVQLGNLGCYAYAHVGWRYVVRPAPNELEVLKLVPTARLVADVGVPRFVQREAEEVAGEIQDAHELAERLGGDSPSFQGAV